MHHINPGTYSQAQMRKQELAEFYNYLQKSHLLLAEHHKKLAQQQVDLAVKKLSSFGYPMAKTMGLQNLLDHNLMNRIENEYGYAVYEALLHHLKYTSPSSHHHGFTRGDAFGTVFGGGAAAALLLMLL